MSGAITDPQFSTTKDSREQALKDSLVDMQFAENFQAGGVQAQSALRDARSGGRYVGLLYDRLERTRTLYGDAGARGYMELWLNVAAPRDSTRW